MGNNRIVLWRYGTGKPELEYDPETDTMFYTADNTTYEMTHDSTERFSFSKDTPGYIRCQQGILNGVIFEHTNWLTLSAQPQQ